MNPQVVAALILQHIAQTGWITNNIATSIAYASHPASVVPVCRLHKAVKEAMYLQANGSLVWSSRLQWWRPRQPGDGPGILQP